MDNLEDIGALEEYIRRTQMILFFLSKGYFRSRARLPLPPASTKLWPYLPPLPRHRTASERFARR